MKCSNCGAELRDGTIVCPRCGKRQSGSLSNDGGNKKRGGLGAGKVFAIVASIVVVVGLSIFAVYKYKNSKPSNNFTHDTSFEKDRLSVIDETTLRYIQVPADKYFNVGSKKGYIDVKIENELGNKVDFVVEKTTREDLFRVKPNGVWDNTHTYTLTLNKNSYFVDEDMYKFNKLVYSIKREEEYRYKLKDSIKNTINNPDEKVEVGDVVTYENEKGEYACGRVISKNGSNIQYAEVALDEVFDDLVLISDNLQPDFKLLIESGELEKRTLASIINSNIFDIFVDTVYASELETQTSMFKLKDELEGQKTDLISKVSDMILNGKAYGPPRDIPIVGDMYVSFKYSDSTKTGKGIGFKVTLAKKLLKEEKKYDNNYDDTMASEKKKAEEAVGVDTTKKKDFLEMIIQIEINPQFSTNIDLKNSVFAVYNYTTVVLDIDFKISGELDIGEQLGLKKGELRNANSNEHYDKSLKTLKSNLHTMNDYNFSKDDGIIVDHKTLFSVPITTPIPFVNLFFRVTHEPKLTAKGSLQMGTHLVYRFDSGIFWDNVNHKMLSDKVARQSNDGSNFHINLEAETEFGWEFKLTTGLEVFLGVNAPIVGQIGVKVGNVNLFATATPYVGVKGTWEWKGQLPIKEWKQESDIEIAIGVKYDIGLEGELKILKAFRGISGKTYFVKGTFYIWQNKNKPATPSEVKNFIEIGPEGSTPTLGTRKYKVIKKDLENGTALLIADGSTSVIVKPYDVKDLGTNEDSLSGSWANSTLDKYLNKEYLETFDEIYRTSMVPKTVKSTGYGEDAKNRKIFILSKEEMEKNPWLDTEEERYFNVPGGIAGAMIGYETNPARNTREGGVVYWLRDTVGKTHSMVVNSSGWINEEGAEQSKKDIVVRPAFWIRYRLDENINQNLNKINQGVYGAGIDDVVEEEGSLDSISAMIEGDAKGDYNSSFSGFDQSGTIYNGQ